jgi:hypothetical protein
VPPPENLYTRHEDLLETKSPELPNELGFLSEREVNHAARNDNHHHHVDRCPGGDNPDTAE